MLLNVKKYNNVTFVGHVATTVLAVVYNLSLTHLLNKKCK